ncbi:hypothetical protein OUZ56_031378 [Daphnia magna]|uniref:Uncharacterized protein n=1 Tax=Daphnia magna TaxID=35525 RepID=A0ABQ9ZU25_9CRUS|nr:hypothetical protein OUZ56_031378 [Daphnia magna]
MVVRMSNNQAHFSQHFFSPPSLMGRRNAEHGSPTSKTSFKCPRLGSICSERPSVCKPDRQDDDGMFIQRIIRPSAPSPVTL